MTILAKKLHIKGTDGVTHDVNLYTTEAEAAGTGAYAHVIVDGNAAYFSLGAASDTYVTRGYIKQSDGKSFCIREKGLPLYGSSEYNSSGNFTVPAGAIAVQVTVAGAGGGGYAVAFPTISHAGGSGDKQVSTVSVTPGNTYYISVGIGGVGGRNSIYSTAGGASSAFGVTAGGGAGAGTTKNGANAGNGQGATGGSGYNKGNNGWVTVEWGGAIGA